jgi:hypothetical protein
MELVHIAKLLWSKRLLVVGAAALALVGALVLTSRLSLMPPALKDPTVRVGAATAESLVESPKSTIGDLHRDTFPLVARTGIFARFLGADGATQAIARHSGIPREDIGVVGPKLTISGVPDQAAAERANRVRGASPYLLQVQTGDELPLLAIFAQAPTEDGAQKIADGTAAALAEHIANYQAKAGIPERRRVTIRQLGTTRAGTIVENPGHLGTVVAFFVLLGLACFAILAWPAIKANWRIPGGGRGSAPSPDVGADEGMYELWVPMTDRFAKPVNADELRAPSKAGDPFGG